MWLPSSHYVAFVSFLTGLDQADDGWLLDGFSRWLGGTTSIHWSGQIEREVTGKDDGQGGESDMAFRLTRQQSDMCVELLFERLDEFLAQR